MNILVSSLLVIGTWIFIGYFAVGALITRWLPSIMQLYFLIGLIISLSVHIFQLRRIEWRKIIRYVLIFNISIIIISLIPHFFRISSTIWDYNSDNFWHCWSACSTLLLNDLDSFFEKDQKKFWYQLKYSESKSYFDSSEWVWYRAKFDKWELKTWDIMVWWWWTKEEWKISKDWFWSFYLNGNLNRKYEFISLWRISALRNVDYEQEYIFPIEEWLMFINFAAPPNENAWFRYFLKK